MAYRPIRFYNGPEIIDPEVAQDTEPGFDGKPYDVIGFSGSYDLNDARTLGVILVAAGLTSRVSKPFVRPSFILEGEEYIPDPRLPDGTASNVHIAVEPPLPAVEDMTVDQLFALKHGVNWNIDTGNGCGGIIDNRKEPVGEDRLGGQVIIHIN